MRITRIASHASIQPNTANPFKKTLISILHSKHIPSLSALESTLGYLGNQEDKLHAIACGMGQSKHGRECTRRVNGIHAHPLPPISPSSPRVFQDLLPMSLLR